MGLPRVRKYYQRFLHVKVIDRQCYIHLLCSLRNHCRAFCCKTKRKGEKFDILSFWLNKNVQGKKKTVQTVNKTTSLGST